jgi:nitrogen fixation protein NifB
MALDRSRHPCFAPSARHRFGRIHLPVAPRCNMQCNYCNRRHDCLNESRPGVSSTLLTPQQALEYLKQVRTQIPDIAVIGIAGPGDPFASARQTMETLRLVRDADPELLLCVATNGLQVGPYIEELAALQVSHVTLTINAVDPEIGRQVYAWVRDGTRVLRGLEAARTLLARQLEAVRAFKELGVTVKVNTIVLPGINQDHVAAVAAVVAGLGADVLNCMPLYPVQGTPFEKLGEPGPGLLADVRARAGKHLPQMRHCTRCRADAAGKLGEAMPPEVLACLQSCTAGPRRERPHVAVASAEGMLVNLHLGEADQFLIVNAQGQTIETRPAPPPGGGAQRWQDLAALLGDCRAVLVSGAGETPRQVLAEAGVPVHLTEGLVSDAVEAIYRNQPVAPPRRAFRCGEACSGQGAGCG